MPSKNTVREYASNSFYHVYNRGAGERSIFHDAIDKAKFISLIARYVAPRDEREEDDQIYPEYDIEINAYCIMGNHFHLLVYLADDIDALSGLMRSVSTAYSMYYNKKYKSHGHVFQGIFKASRIDDDSYFAHITRYIHMNPRTYLTYKWSSLPAFIGESYAPWIKPDRVKTMNPAQYLAFLEGYEGRKAELELLKDELAG